MQRSESQRQKSLRGSGGNALPEKFKMLEMQRHGSATFIDISS